MINLHNLPDDRIPIGFLGLAVWFPYEKYVWFKSKKWLYVQGTSPVNEKVPYDEEFIAKYYKSGWKGRIPANITIKD